jgi:hypothetical protein
MADRDELIRVVLDVAKRTVNGSDYKEEALVEALARQIPSDERVRVAFSGSVGRKMVCLLAGTEGRVIIAERINQMFGWNCEAIPFRKIDSAEMVAPATGGGFWASLGEMMFRTCKLHLADGPTISISAIDVPAMERLAELVNEAADSRRRTESRGANAVHIGSVNRGNVSISSTGVRQSINVNDELTERFELLRKEVDAALRRLPRGKRDEVLADVDTLESELVKPSPNKRVLNLVLDNLATLPQIAAAVEGIRAVLGF